VFQIIDQSYSFNALDGQKTATNNGSGQSSNQWDVRLRVKG